MNRVHAAERSKLISYWHQYAKLFAAEYGHRVRVKDSLWQTEASHLLGIQRCTRCYTVGVIDSSDPPYVWGELFTVECLETFDFATHIMYGVSGLLGKRP